jgi:hypothetical protein
LQNILTQKHIEEFIAYNEWSLEELKNFVQCTKHNKEMRKQKSTSLLLASTPRMPWIGVGQLRCISLRLRLILISRLNCVKNAHRQAGPAN